MYSVIWTLSWSVHYNLVRVGRYTEYSERGWECTPPSHQAGLIVPSWLNVRQKVAVATLCLFCGFGCPRQPWCPPKSKNAPEYEGGWGGGVCQSSVVLTVVYFTFWLRVLIYKQSKSHQVVVFLSNTLIFYKFQGILLHLSASLSATVHPVSHLLYCWVFIYGESGFRQPSW